MIISSLCDYYQFIKRRGEAEPVGYSGVRNVRNLVLLNQDGSLNNIITEDLTPYNADEDIIVKEFLPERTEKPGIFANVIEHRSAYLFGAEEVKDNTLKITSKSIAQNEAFKKLNLEFFKDFTLEESPLAVAYRNFIQNWDIERERDNPILISLAGNYTNSCKFALASAPEKFLHKDKAVLAKWDRYFETNKEENTLNEGQCSVSGRYAKIANLHRKIKGIKGAQSSGCLLVCTNNPSEESYNKTQSYNNAVSYTVMRQYTESLNYLIERRRHRTILDPMTIVHFALAEKEKDYLDYINDEIDPFIDNNKEVEADDELDESLKNTVTKIRQGDKPTFERLDDNVQYCIFGLVPNSARLSVRFSYRNTFGAIRKNIEAYHNDFAMEGKEKAPSFYQIRRDLSSQVKKSAGQKPDAGGGGGIDLDTNLQEHLFRSMLMGEQFPIQMLETAVRRTKVDLSASTDSKKEGKVISEKSDKNKKNKGPYLGVKASIIKAYINRKNKKEIITMALNTENKTPAYLCGRLFAVLEKIQKESSEELNKTIKETYFASACATPAIVFPKLFTLSQNHLSKLSTDETRGKGTKIYFEKLLGDIVDGLEEFPKTLSLEQQGLFVIGYYQQNRDFYKPKENKEEN